jgi:hypothetical protein
MRIHVIAMGGAVMHNLSIALHLAGHTVTGSDDEIYNPAKDRLQDFELLPPFGGTRINSIVVLNWLLWACMPKKITLNLSGHKNWV